jgi:hypothetical protein
MGFPINASWACPGVVYWVKKFVSDPFIGPKTNKIIGIMLIRAPQSYF